MPGAKPAPASTSDACRLAASFIPKSRLTSDTESDVDSTTRPRLRNRRAKRAWLPDAVANTTRSAESSRLPTVTGEPHFSDNCQARSGSRSTTATRPMEWDGQLAKRCTNPAPTTPAPTTRMSMLPSRSRSDVVAAADLPPPTRLRRHAPGSPSTQNGSNGCCPCQRNQRSSQNLHNAHPNEPQRRRNRARVVGLAGFEPATSPLSGVRSNRLSYSPVDGWRSYFRVFQAGQRNRRGRVRGRWRAVSSSMTVTLIPPVRSLMRLNSTHSKTLKNVPATTSTNPPTARPRKIWPALNLNSCSANSLLNERLGVIHCARPHRDAPQHYPGQHHDHPEAQVEDQRDLQRRPGFDVPDHSAHLSGL